MKHDNYLTYDWLVSQDYFQQYKYARRILSELELPPPVRAWLLVWWIGGDLAIADFGLTEKEFKDLLPSIKLFDEYMQNIEVDQIPFDEEEA